MFKQYHDNFVHQSLPNSLLQVWKVSLGTAGVIIMEASLKWTNTILKTYVLFSAWFPEKKGLQITYLEKTTLTAGF